MPEGPEVRKYADSLDSILTGHRITGIGARTKHARAWLNENAHAVIGQRVTRVVSHGKHIIGYIEGGFYFHSHLMMWGRWQTYSARRKSTTPLAFQRGKFVPDRDRRERARGTRALRYDDVVEMIDAAKGAGANSIALVIEDVPMK
jgi:formamidopyrimidine-DNA glycosylase